MTISAAPLVRGTVWTIGSYGIGQGLRLVTNVILARLLAPELFGIMLIVNSVKIGITLVADFGIGQNIIYNKNGNQPEFYNTAWSLELIRNLVLGLACLVAAAPLAHFYESSILIWVLPVSAITFLLTGFSSVSRFLLQKRMELAKLNMFETIVVVIGSVTLVLFAYLTPTIWALVLGGVFTSAISMVGSYYLLPEVRPQFFISKEAAREILTFGKWIVISSVIYFLSLNYDRLYLPKLLPLDVLGVYGVARSISELLGMLTSRLGSVVLFPFIASYSHMPRAALHAQLASMRAKFLLVGAFAISLLVATIDLAVGVLYDERYQDAGWMLPVLFLGSWFSVLVTANDATLVAVGKPSYSAIANGAKFVFLVIGLPLGFATNGIVGVVLIVALADVCRYIPIFIGQWRERLSFGMQDLLLTLAAFGLVWAWQWLRWSSGYGTSFDTLPLEMGALGAPQA